MLEFFLDWMLYASWALLGLVFFQVVFFVGLSSRHHARHKRHHPRKLAKTPLVSVLVPSYNEGITLENCIQSLMNQSYENYEILIIDDGSNDDTLQIARQLARKYSPRIRLVICRNNGGKATALNRGIARARGDILVCVDADSIFIHDTIEQLVLSFQDPDVAAVGGNVKVANRKKSLSRQQSLEYISGLTLQRKAFAHLGCMQVISGAIGAFRRDALLAIGGYSTTTIVEDMDTTIELARQGYKVVYNPSAIAYTEAPESLNAFLKQRHRWTYGSFQVLAKHRRTLIQRKARRMGLIGLPYFMLAPWLNVLVSLLFILILPRAFVSENNGQFFLMIGTSCLLQALLVCYALVMDKEDKRLLGIAVIHGLFYYHLISYTSVKAGISYCLSKNEKSWNKLERYGKNIRPELGQTPALVPVVAADETV